MAHTCKIVKYKNLRQNTVFQISSSPRQFYIQRAECNFGPGGYRFYSYFWPVLKFNNFFFLSRTFPFYIKSNKIDDLLKCIQKYLI